MATSNTQVTVYLPDHILEYVTEYCTQYGIVRKKNSTAILATGIVDLLNILVNIPIEELSTAKSSIPDIDVEGIIEKKLSDSTVLSTLLDTLLDDSTLTEKLRRGLLPVTINNGTDNAPNTLPDTLPVNDYENEETPGGDEEIAVNESSIEPLPKDDSNPYVKSLTMEVMAEAIVEEVKEEKPVKESKGKTPKLDLVREYLESLPTGHVIPNLAVLVESAGIAKTPKGKTDTSFLSRNEGKAILKQYLKDTGNGYKKL